jgi:uncharacterized protein YggE
MARESRRGSAIIRMTGVVAGAAGILLPLIWLASRDRGARPGAGQAPGEARREITVTGRGTVSVAPDEARIEAGIQVRAATAREAGAQGAAAMQRVIAALKAQGVDDTRIQTGYYGIHPQYSQRTEEPIMVGYIVTNTVIATITQLDRVGPILDALVEAGGDEVTIHGVHLGARNTTEAQTQARSAAVTAARAQAEQMARDLGVRLGEPLSARHSDDSWGGGRRMQSYSAMAAMHAPTPIEPGEIDISVVVEVVWAML